MLRMTSAFRRSGVPRSAVITMMQSWAKGMDAAEVAKHVGDVFDKGYKYGCNDSLMSKHCDPHCIYFKKKNYNVETSDTDSMRKTYAEYLRKLQNGKSINLKDYYSMAKDFKMLPGEFITVIGDTGIGKTAWVQNLVVDFKVKTLYLSLEVHEALLFRRFIQIANNLTKEDVDNSFLHLNENVLDALTKNIKHINVCTVPPTLNAIERMIAEDQPQLVVIDTLDGIDVEGKTITEKTMIISPELKRIANATNTVIIGIHHISKSAAIDNTGIRKHLNVHSGIGASSTEHKADKLIGIEADGGNHTPLRHITSLKARDEAPFIRMPFHYDIKTFKFKQINQRLELGGKNE
jgi:predicted ATP-dependent serine protease